MLGVSPDHSSTLVFADGEGAMRIGLGIGSDGEAGLTVYDLEEEPLDAADGEGRS